jgi:hypothetical protein
MPRYKQYVSSIPVFDLLDSVHVYYYITSFLVLAS